jgi:hypothetical protein
MYFITLYSLKTERKCKYLIFVSGNGHGDSPRMNTQNHRVRDHRVLDTLITAICGGITLLGGQFFMNTLVWYRGDGCPF